MYRYTGRYRLTGSDNGLLPQHDFSVRAVFWSAHTLDINTPRYTVGSCP